MTSLVDYSTNFSTAPISELTSLAENEQETAPAVVSVSFNAPEPPPNTENAKTAMDICKKVNLILFYFIIVNIINLCSLSHCCFFFSSH